MSFSFLPRTWPTTRLEKSGQWLSGGTPSRSESSYWGGDIPWIGSKDVKGFELSGAQEHVTEVGSMNGTRLVGAGTIIFVVRGMSLAKEFRVGLTTREVAFNQDLKAIIPRKELDPRFFAWYLTYIGPRVLLRVETASHGTKRLPTGQITGLPVPLPPLPEQRRITAILDKADAIRRKRKEVIALTEAFLRSAFLEMFGDPVTNPRGWPVKKLGEVTNFKSGSTLPNGVDFAEQTGGYLLLKVAELNMPENNPLIRASRKWTDQSGARAATCSAGAIILPKRGGAISTNKKRRLGRSAVLDPNLMGVEPQAVLHSLYLHQWFKLFDLNTITSGSTVPQLNKKDLAPLRIAVPPRELQTRYKNITSRAEQHRHVQHAAYVESYNLFNSLVQRAFKGEL